MIELAFALVYEKWIAAHLKQRTGESKRRLITGHQHAEKLFLETVWYLAFNHFDHLFPEYEVIDFRDGTRFIDFAYIRYPLQLAIEIDGFQSHAAGINRWQFSDSLIRQNHLVIHGWTILRFSYDDVKDKPMMCIQMLQQFIGSRLPENFVQFSAAELLQNDILRLAVQIGRPLRPIDVRNHLRIGRDKVDSLLRCLLDSGRIIPGGKGTDRLCCFIVNREKLKELPF